MVEQVEFSAVQNPSPGRSREWGNALPVLHEIRHALRQLIEEGRSTTIDLRALPFGPGDEDHLLNALGRGEVQATLDTLGPTEIWESAYTGVWVVDHRNREGQRIALAVEVTQVPGILLAQQVDLPNSLARLSQTLAATESSTPKAHHQD